MKDGFVYVDGAKRKVGNYVKGYNYGCGFVVNGTSINCYGQYKMAYKAAPGLTQVYPSEGILDLTSNKMVKGDLSGAPVGNFPIFKMGAKFENYFEVVMNKSGNFGLDLDILATNLLLSASRNSHGIPS